MKDSSGLYVGVMEATRNYTGTVPEWCFKTVGGGGGGGRAPEANAFVLKTPPNIRKNCTKTDQGFMGHSLLYICSERR